MSVPILSAVAQVDSGDTAWMLVATALVLMMTPAWASSTPAWCARRTRSTPS